MSSVFATELDATLAPLDNTKKIRGIKNKLTKANRQ